MTERAYLDLLRDVMENGVDRGDRTGTGTRSVFGRQIRFDLSKGFPLLTTKKVFLRGIIEELLFFLSGETNAKILEDKGVNIWKQWGDENRNLGPVYSHQWRNFGGAHKNRPQPKASIPAGYEPTICGVASQGNYLKGADYVEDKLFVTWKGMIARCYNKGKDHYSYYGERGVSVADRWLVFTNFSSDVKELLGWEEKLADWSGYALDKDIYGDGFIYSAETCVWVSRSKNMRQKNSVLYTVEHEDGRIEQFQNPVAFYTANNISQGNFCSMLRGDRPIAGGWSLVGTKDMKQGVDQIAELVERLKKDPYSRRHVVNAWNPVDLPYMTLPPCHCQFQLYVRPLSYKQRCDLWYLTPYRDADPGASGLLTPERLDQDGIPKVALDCQLYQRSGDIFLGIPFNIASYALLTMMLAQQCGYAPGEFVHTFGDVHLYANHFEQAQEQLSREPYPFPEMVIRKAPDIFSYTIDSFELRGYQSHPTIKAPVAV